MKARFTALAMALMTAPLALHAQTVTMTFSGVAGTNDGHYYTGNYSATVNGNPAQVPINCVDFFHDVTFGEVWTANQTSVLGDLSNTRLVKDAHLTQTDARKLYEEGAWLTSQYNTHPSDINNIQHAIWSMFGAAYNNPLDGSANYFMTGPSNTLDPAAQAWVALAAASYTSMNFSGTVIYTDVRVGTNADAAAAQEFLSTTPEPASFALLGTGLAGLIPALRRRRRA